MPNNSLSQLHPKLIDAVIHLLSAFDALGFPLKVIYTVRTDAEQHTLYAQGRTAPGKIVTNCDGITSKSKHQVQADGFGHACDLTFLVNGQPSWDSTLPFKALGECAKALGLTWGGDFHSLPDLDHVELP